LASSAERQRIQVEVRQAGGAVTSGAVVTGVVSVAAPVFTAAEALPLAVSIALPARQAPAAELQRVTAGYAPGSWLTMAAPPARSGPGES